MNSRTVRMRLENFRCIHHGQSDHSQDPVPAALQGGRKEALGGLGVAPVGEVEVERRAFFVDRAVEILPPPLHSHVGLIDPPGERQPAAVPSRTLFQLRRIALRPAVQRRVVDGDAPLVHHFLELAVADAVAAVPTNRPENDLAGEVPPPEHGHHPYLPTYWCPLPCSAGFCNRWSGPIRPTPLATLGGRSAQRHHGGSRNLMAAARYPLFITRQHWERKVQFRSLCARGINSGRTDFGLLHSEDRRGGWCSNPGENSGPGSDIRACAAARN